MKIPWHHQILIGFAGIMLLCLLSCSDGDSPPDNIGDVLDIISDPAFSSVATANTRFGFNLLSDVQSREPGTNIFISPLSISIALTMTYNGAVGETQLAMAEVLEIEGLDRDSVNRSNAALRESLENRGSEVQLSIANSIWGRQGVEFNPDFLNRNREFFWGGNYRAGFWCAGSARNDQRLGRYKHKGENKEDCSTHRSPDTDYVD